MIIKKTIDFNDIKKMELDNHLMVEKVHTAIVSGDEDALKDLIFATVRALEKNNIYMEKYYYGKYVPMSDELFDMFTLDTIDELFSAYGYEVGCTYIGESIDEWDEVPEGYLAGTLYLEKDGYTFVTNIIHAMHDSLISMFIDAKNFGVIATPLDGNI